MKENLIPRLSLFLGGAASGKSAAAEALADRSGLPRRYLATAQAWDDEMRAKIDRHRTQRGAGWQTIECPLALADAIAAVEPETVVLVDCLTLWLSNHLLAEHDLDAEAAQLRQALRITAARVILVSNETGLGIVPDNALARGFREAQGRLNQEMAAQADLVVLVTAGLPLTLKGQFPGETP